MVNDMIKRRLLMVAAALAVGTSVAGAQERLGPPVPGAHLLPAHEIITILRSTGFDPVGRPVRIGSRYEVQAIDPDDYGVRLLVDGHTGRILTVRDSEDAWPMEPPVPPAGFRQAAGRFGPLSYGPLRPGGLVPPRGIPSRRSSATLDPQKAPVPRPRPEVRHEPAVVSNAPSAPGTAKTATKPSTPSVPSTASAPNTPPAPTIAAKPDAGSAPSTASAPSPSVAPRAASAGIKGTVGAINGKNEKTASTAAHTLAPSGPPAPDATSPAKANDAIKVVPVVPLE
jgi:hypothetical protein